MTLYIFDVIFGLPDFVSTSNFKNVLQKVNLKKSSKDVNVPKACKT